MDKIELAKWAYLVIGLGAGALVTVYLAMSWAAMTKRVRDE